MFQNEQQQTNRAVCRWFYCLHTAQLDTPHLEPGPAPEQDGNVEEIVLSQISGAASLRVVYAGSLRG